MATHRTSLVLGPDDAGLAVSEAEFAEAEFVEHWTYEREDGRLVLVPLEGQGNLDDQGWSRVDDGMDRIFPARRTRSTRHSDGDRAEGRGPRPPIPVE